MTEMKTGGCVKQNCSICNIIKSEKAIFIDDEDKLLKLVAKRFEQCPLYLVDLVGCKSKELLEGKIKTLNAYGKSDHMTYALVNSKYQCSFIVHTDSGVPCNPNSAKNYLTRCAARLHNLYGYEVSVEPHKKREFYWVVTFMLENKAQSYIPSGILNMTQYFWE